MKWKRFLKSVNWIDSFETLFTLGICALCLYVVFVVDNLPPMPIKLQYVVCLAVCLALARSLFNKEGEVIVREV